MIFLLHISFPQCLSLVWAQDGPLTLQALDQALNIMTSASCQVDLTPAVRGVRCAHAKLNASTDAEQSVSLTYGDLHPCCVQRPLIFCPGSI